MVDCGDRLLRRSWPVVEGAGIAPADGTVHPDRQRHSADDLRSAVEALFRRRADQRGCDHRLGDPFLRLAVHAERAAGEVAQPMSPRTTWLAALATGAGLLAGRSEERRGGQGCDSRCRSRWWT